MTELIYVPSGYDPRLDQHPKITWLDRFSFIPKYYEECKFIKKHTGLSVHRIYIADDSIYYRVYRYRGMFRDVDQKPQLSLDKIETLVRAMQRHLTYMDGWLRMECLPS